MKEYELQVTVTYNYTVEAESWDEAEKQGWEYEDWSHTAQVESIDVTELDNDEYDDEDN
jgi:hypothetical protein